MHCRRACSAGRGTLRAEPERAVCLDRPQTHHGTWRQETQMRSTTCI
jgi:hypothetical protein